MRPAGRDELDSLYFTYEHFGWREAPEQRGERSAAEVAIVGAGPVGLLAAIVLGSLGARVVLVEAKDHINDGSRATCIAGFNFDTFRQFHSHREFIDKALPWTDGRSYFRTEEIYRLRMPHGPDDRHYPMYNLQQQYTEQFLINSARKLGDAIDFRWLTRAKAVRQEGDGVELDLENPGGCYTLRVPWLIAADGGKSTVRQALGLRLRGDNFPGRYVIADVQVKMDFPTERRAFFQSPANPDATLLIHRQPDDIWRMDWQLGEEEDAAAALAEEAISERVQAILAMLGERAPWRLEWWSLYTANTLCLDDYRHGRVFFAGDAAHIVPIFGVRGLNNGFADALDIAWKLAYVLRGRAAPGLLDSYSPERRGATLDVFANATRSSRFMTPPSDGFRILRQAVLELSLRETFTRAFANPRQVTPYRYADSPLTAAAAAPDATAVGPGCLLPNLRLGEDDYLLDHLGQGFCALLVAPTSAAAAELAGALRELDPHARVLALGGSGDAAGATAVKVLPAAGAAAAERLRADAGSVLLLRPDRYLLARWPSLDVAAVVAALRACLAGTVP